MLGICTHLDVSSADKGEYNAGFVLCHGSHTTLQEELEKAQRL